MVLAAVAFALTASSEPVDLYRQFKAGEELEYEVKSNLMVERRHYLTSTYIPDEIDQNYKFTMKVVEILADGFAKIDYRRPEMTIILGETAFEPPVKEIEELNWRFTMTLSPVNALTDVIDLTPKKDDDDGDGGMLRALSHRAKGQAQDSVMNFMVELYRLALFVGSLDTAIDLAPRLPLFEVEPGETWEETVAYQPQKLKGSGKVRPQRLDYTYTFIGLIEKPDGTKVYRVTADLELDTDAAPFVNDMLGMKPSESGLSKIILKIKSHIDFDLDPETKRTLSARARSDGEAAIWLTQLPTVAYIEEKIRGRTTMKLLRSQ
ncbi:MAG: hypothetical protein IH944_05125 [Armatimonadetes bacterium]|nr:hypothetical protein [Armatimonadota bacterium]